MAKVSGQAGKVVTSTNDTIDGAAGTTTITVDSNTHAFAVGDRVLIESVGGMTDLNGEHTVTASTPGTDYQVVIPTTAQTYTSGGTAKTCSSITAWSMDISTEPIKVTDSEVATWDEYIPKAFTSATGSFEVFFETAVSDISLGSTALILRMNSGDYYTVTALITGNSSTVDVPGSEAIKKTYTFQTTSTITRTVA